jgi:hypothetical protein
MSSHGNFGYFFGSGLISDFSEVKSLSALGLNTHTYEQVLNLTKLNQGLVVEEAGVSRENHRP